ncbi:uncharacterized protein LOC127842160 [Dreissena polymorpha]|uniref:RING-type domain-containing protein n=1 Tax=Dreissena polymorpha TaxID=45954 RepID=A0A9D4IY24_DREPO|nr:uncharacterized protein LOC127842160 [Dreissena polymorpha]KAH3788989.1 hypothetical protein DPMN_167155 [Dreissena polymorpha]
MVAWSTVIIPDGNSSSSDESLKHGNTKHAETLDDTLKCYVCDEFFTKPRILPCGHSFCSECVLKLRENAVSEFNKSRDQNAHRRGDCGYFSCPWPNCHYTMRIMNVNRWTLKNRALAKAVSLAKKREKEKQETSVQTDTDWSQTIVNISSAVTNPFGKRNNLQKRQPEMSIPDVIYACTVKNAVSKESLTESTHWRLPQENGGKSSTWSSYVFLAGMALVDQVLKPF